MDMDKTTYGLRGKLTRFWDFSVEFLKIFKEAKQGGYTGVNYHILKLHK